MINFLQVIAAAAAVNVQYTVGVLTMFEASEYIGALTTAALSRPVDCIISSSSATVRSVWRTLASIFAPATVIGIFTAVWGVITFRENKCIAYLWKRIFLSINAVIYISYLGLTKLAVRVFYCVEVYNSADPFSNTMTKYLAMDTAVQCYKKGHLGLIFIAIVVILTVTVSFPIGSAFLLFRIKTRTKQTRSWTSETMGFLYRAFKEEFMYWESLIMFRKAFLSIVVVFAYPLGGQIQGLLSLAGILFCLYLHLVCFPFRKEFHVLNYYESASLLVSCFTFLLGQFLAIDRRSNSTKTLVAVLIIFINVVFFLILSFAFFFSGVDHVKTVLQAEGQQVPRKAGWWVILKLYFSSRFDKYINSKN